MTMISTMMIWDHPLQQQHLLRKLKLRMLPTMLVMVGDVVEVIVVGVAAGVVVAGDGQVV